MVMLQVLPCIRRVTTYHTLLKNMMATINLASFRSTISIKIAIDEEYVNYNFLDTAPLQQYWKVILQTISVVSSSIFLAEAIDISAVLAAPNEYQPWEQQIGVTAAVQQLGRDGRGTSLAVLDSGSSISTPDLLGSFDTVRSISLVDNQWWRDLHGHGTAVASTALGRRNGSGMVGVAPQASLITVKIANPNPLTPLTGKVFASNANIVKAIRYAAQNGAAVINLSYGDNNWTPENLGSLHPGLLEALQYAAQRSVIVVAAGNEGLTKLSGNAMYLLRNGVAGSGIIAGSVNSRNMPSTFTNTPNNWSWDGNAARNFYLVAPGENILLPNALGSPGALKPWKGTSFSAPEIAGAALLVKAAHPFLTPQQVVGILLASAQDLGAPGPDDVYGRGLLRVDRALSPIGTARIPTGATVNGSSIPLSGSSLATGRALGSLASVRAALAGGVIFDDFGRDFRADLGAGITTPRATLSVVPEILRGRATRLTQMPLLTDDRLWVSAPAESDGVLQTDVDRWRSTHFLEDVTRLPTTVMPAFAFGGSVGNSFFALGFGPGATATLSQTAGERSALFFTGGAEVSQPLLALADGGSYGQVGYNFSDKFSLSASFATTSVDRPDLGLQGNSHALAVQTAYRLSQTIAFDMTQTYLTEIGGALGTLSSGALSFGKDSDTFAIGVGATLDLPFQINARASFTEAVSRFQDSGDSLLRHASAMHSRAIGISLTKSGLFDDKDVFGISVSKPLRVYDAHADLNVPVGRDFDGTVQYRHARASLVPDGSETDIEFSYLRRIGDGVLGSINFVHQEDAGHVRGLQSDLAFARLRFAF